MMRSSFYFGTSTFNKDLNFQIAREKILTIVYLFSLSELAFVSGFEIYKQKQYILLNADTHMVDSCQNL